MGEREIAEEALLKEGSRNVYKKDLNFGTTRNGSTMKYLTRELLAASQTMKNKKKNTGKLRAKQHRAQFTDNRIFKGNFSYWCEVRRLSSEKPFVLAKKLKVKTRVKPSSPPLIWLWFSAPSSDRCGVRSQIDFPPSEVQEKKRRNHDKKHKKLLMKLLILSIITLSFTRTINALTLRLLLVPLVLLSRKYLFSLSDEMNTLLHVGRWNDMLLLFRIIKSVLCCARSFGERREQRKKRSTESFLGDSFLFHYAINIL